MRAVAKLYAGGRIRTVRRDNDLTQVDMGQRLGISTSYLNQLENNQRPLTVSVLVGLTSVFGLDPAYFSGDDERRTLTELAGLLPGVAPAVVRDMAARYPAVADAIVAIPSSLGIGAANPYAAVRTFFQDNRNHFADLDRAAEELAAAARGRQARLTSLAAAFDKNLGVTVRFNQDVGGPRSVYDVPARELRLRTGLTEAQQCFEMAYHYGLLSLIHI